MTQQYLLLNEVARLIKCKGHQIAYLITNGVIDEPKLRINNKRIFTAADVARVRQAIEAKKARKEARAR
jgi:DNA-binding transcriptional MerR regulator